MRQSRFNRSGRLSTHVFCTPRRSKPVVFLGYELASHGVRRNSYNPDMTLLGQYHKVYASSLDTIHCIRCPRTRSLYARHRIRMSVCMINRTVNCSTWNGLFLMHLMLLILQHCKLMVINFTYFRILMFNLLKPSGNLTYDQV
jgi:hypothetical protein